MKDGHSDTETGATPVAVPVHDMDIKTCALGLLHSVGNQINVTGAAAYRNWHKIGISEFRLLVVIGNAPGITGAGIHDVLGLDMGAVSRTLRKIEARQLVESRPHPRHASYRCWHLTRAGAALHDRVSRMTLARKAALLDGFSQKETTLLLSFLRRLSNNTGKLEQIAEDGVLTDEDPR